MESKALDGINDEKSIRSFLLLFFYFFNVLHSRNRNDTIYISFFLILDIEITTNNA